MRKLAEIREQVGQLLIMGFDGTSASPQLSKLLSSVRPSGVILFARNIESAAQTHSLLADCRKFSSLPMFLCVDMEGGTVDRLKNVITPAPSAARVFASGKKKLWRQQGALIGKECRLLGFNTDFAPVSDLGFEASRSVLGARAVSAHAKETISYVREFLRGLRAANILGCGKHFPGLGEANLDSHHDLPIIDKEWKYLWREDLYPYRALHKSMPFVMVAHCAYPEVTGDRLPASLSSKWMTEILRKKIGYRGLIISDDLEMGGVLNTASIEEACVETLRAGADMFLVCHNEEFVTRSFEAVLREAARDKKFAKSIANAAHRVLAFKSRSKPLRRFPAAPSARAIRRMRRQLEKFAEGLPA